MTDATRTEYGDELDPVDALMTEFARRYRNGERPSIEEYARAHPEHEESIRALFPTVLEMERARRTTLAERTPGTETAPSALVGHRLGDFDVLDEIGRGGMGVVYEAEQRSLGRRVALKVLPRQTLLDRRQLQRFDREARTAARLHHTNIVPVFGVGEDQGHHFYVMQRIAGVSLKEHVAAWKRVALHADPAWDRAHARRVANIGLQIAEALAYAHAQGTLHRDVKPSNLLLERIHSATESTDDGVDATATRRDLLPAGPDLDETPALHAWITDFGLARAASAGPALTMSGDVIGTLQYMAPEQLRSQYDERSEIHALGLTLYEILVLQPVHRDDDRAGLLDSVQKCQVVPPRKVRRHVPRDLETILLRCLAPEPARRYASAQALAEDLERFLDGVPVRARRANPLEHVSRWAARNRLAASFAALAMVGVLAAAVSGWIGFVQVSSALDKVRDSATKIQDQQDKTAEALGVAQAERERAESMLQSALDQLAGLLETLAGPDLDPTSTGTDDDPFSGNELDRHDLLLVDQVVAFYEAFAEQNKDDPRLAEQTAVALRRVGDVRSRIGNFREAEQAYTAAFGRLQRLRTLANADERSRSVDLRLELARVRNGLGYAAIGAAGGLTQLDNGLDLLRIREHFAAAVHLLATDGHSTSIPLELEDPVWLFERARARHAGAELLARVLEARRPWQDRPADLRLLLDQPMGSLQTAFEELLALAGRFPEVDEFAVELAQCAHDYGERLTRTGETASARAVFYDTIDALERARANDSLHVHAQAAAILCAAARTLVPDGDGASTPLFPREQRVEFADRATAIVETCATRAPEDPLWDTLARDTASALAAAENDDG